METVSLLPLYANKGLAVALNTGIAQAKTDGYKMVVALDQDSIGQSGMIDELTRQMIALAADKVAIVAPAVWDVAETGEYQKKDHVRLVKRAITSGSLIDVAAWDAVGGFNELLFVDWVDFDFCARLRQAGYKIAETQNTFLLHEMGAKEPALGLWLGKGEEKRFVGLFRTNHSFPRRCDKARSWVITVDGIQDPKVRFEERVHIFVIAAKDLVCERNKREVLDSFKQGKKAGREALKNR